MTKPFLFGGFEALFLYSLENIKSVSKKRSKAIEENTNMYFKVPIWTI